MLQRFLIWAVLAAVPALPAAASTIYYETFDNGTALASDPLVNYSGIGSYWQTGSGEANGIVTPCTGPGAGCYGSGNVIPYAAGGTGDFLFENTGGDGCCGDYTFFDSSSFAVTQNTEYTVSFDLVNGTTCCFAQVEAEINGVSLGSAVSANGYITDGNASDGWQQFSFTWNSGSNTTANVSLLDLNLGGYGNDFGVDSVCVSTGGACSTAAASPEPLSALLLGSALIATGLARRARLR